MIVHSSDTVVAREEVVLDFWHDSLASMSVSGTSKPMSIRGSASKTPLPSLSDACADLFRRSVRFRKLQCLDSDRWNDGRSGGS